MDMEQLANPGLPKTVNEAVERLVDILSTEEKLGFAATAKDDLINHHFGLGLSIRSGFGLHTGNPELLESCGVSHPDDASMVILEALWSQVITASTTSSIR
ncbi:MAG: DUF6794 domain-containing protein [Sedimenticola sp.]